MGMASSDDEKEIMREHYRNEHMKARPARPGSYDHPMTEDQRAFYRHDLERWAAGLDAYESPNGGYLA